MYGWGEHGGAVVTHLPPTSGLAVQTLEHYVGKILTNGRQFTVQNLDQLYVLVSSVYKTIRRNMTYTLLKRTLNPK